jgi:acyl-CoA synthetase (AMP-forming)/AMP-acid ligase II
VPSITTPATAWSTLVDLLEYRSQHQPERTAFTFLENGEREAGSLSFGELARRARCVGHELEIAGARGGTVALLYPSGLDFIGALFGCFYAGATAVPALPPRADRSIDRLTAILEDSRPVVALTTEALRVATESAWSADRNRPPLVATDEMFSEGDFEWAPRRGEKNAPAVLQYTSGSTGSPRGAVITHGNVLHNQELIRDRFEHGDDTVMVTWLPMFHDMGLIGKTIHPVFLGRPCVLMSPGAFLQKPRRWLNAISRYGATTSGGPNFAYDLCVDRVPEPERAGLALDTWQVAFNGSEPVRASTLERFTRAYSPHGFRPEAFYPCYGLAEATLLVAGGKKSEPPLVTVAPESENEDSGESAGARLVVACGRAEPEQRLRIVDPDGGSIRSEREVGEIWIAGPSVASGYWNRPEESEAAFGGRLQEMGEKRFLRTGDLGFIADGELYVTGRLKEVLIVRGRNHYPQDIEQTAEASHPALRPGCGAAFLAGENGSERLVVVQELRKKYLRDPPLKEIARRLREAVALEHGLQLAVVVLLKTGTLPKTSSGKIQRRLCRALYLERRLAAVASDPEVHP